MKKLIVLLIAYGIWLMAFPPFVSAQEEEVTPTPTKRKVVSPTPSTASLPAGRQGKSKVEEIKEKIASTVAQLNLVSKKAFIGEVTKLEKTQLTIEKNSETHIIQIDELTKYLLVGKDKKRAEIAFKDLNVGDRIIAIGLYNKESEKLLGRIIVVKEFPANINGVVREVDIKDGMLTIENKKQSRTYVVDIEKTTLIQKYVMAEGLAKSGLSKIEIGERIHVNGMPSEEEENRLTAKRVLLLPGKAIGITTPGAGTKQATEPATPTEKPAKPTATAKPTKKPTPTPTEEAAP